MIRKLKFVSKQRLNYLKWVTEIKKTQRPKWSDPEILSCYICEARYTLLSR